jgi:hypothetical protein
MATQKDDAACLTWLPKYILGNPRTLSKKADTAWETVASDYDRNSFCPA